MPGELGTLLAFAPRRCCGSKDPPMAFRVCHVAVNGLKRTLYLGFPQASSKIKETSNANQKGQEK
jgi:hypothetical protein